MTSRKVGRMQDEPSRDGFLQGRDFYLFLLLVACFLIFPFAFARFWLHFNNSVHTSDRWNPTRSSFENRSPGAFVHMFSRYVYAGDQLNLNCGYGVPEYLYHEPLTLKRVGFDFRVVFGEELYFIFGRRNGQFSGLCLSASYQKDSMFFTASIDGRFRSVSRIKNNFVREDDIWHRAEFEFGQDRIKCFVDGELFFSGPSGGVLPYGRFGFRSSLAGATVDNVEIDSVEHLRVIKDDFRNRRGYSRVFSWGLLIMLVGQVLFFLLFCCDDGVFRPGRIILRMTFFQICVLLLVILLYLCDFFYVGHRIPDRLYIRQFQSWTENPNNRYLSSRFICRWLRMFGDAAALDIAHTDRRVHDSRLRTTRTDEFDKQRMLTPDPEAYRVLFICGEQAFCEERDDWGYVSQVRDNLEHYKPVPGKKVRCINASSLNSCIGGPLRYHYFNHWIHMKPSVMIVGVGRSGACCTLGDEVVREMDVYIKRNNISKIKTVILFEANNPEVEPYNVEQCRQSVMEKQQEWKDVQIIDLDSHMKEINDTGFCWLDEYHLSAYGHERAADFVTNRLREIICGFDD